MKFLKRILNKIEPDVNSIKRDDSDAIFSLTSASVSIEEKLGLQFSGSSALCVKIIDGIVFKNTIKDCTDLLNVSKGEFNFEYNTITDSYDYLWMIITGRVLMTSHSDVITNVAAGLSSAGNILEENGFADQILSAVFKFKFLDTAYSNYDEHEESGYEEKHYQNGDGSNLNHRNSINNTKNLYLIYNYKTNNFYPYVPIDNQKRDTTKELQTLSILKSLISIERDFSKWFPIKDIPF